MEIRIESVNKDNSQSWVRISHGVNKVVTDLIDKEDDDDDEQEPLQRRRKYLRLQAEPRLKQNQEDLQLLAHLQGLYLFVKDLGLILSQKLISPIAYPVAKRLKNSSSTRRITSRRRWCDRILETER